jgi:serine protease Do
LTLVSSRFCRAAASALTAILIVVPAVVFSRPAAARPAPDSFADLADKLLPSVVNISTQQNLKSDRPRA